MPATGSKAFLRRESTASTSKMFSAKVVPT